MNKVKKYIIKIAEIILNILLIVVFAILIIGSYYSIQINVFHNDYANLFGYTFFEVATGSMYPTIEVGDIVIVNITKDVKENDIIVYKDEENFITHRIVKKTSEEIITKGDANNTEDAPINENAILGKVVNKIPHFGTIRKVILSPKVIGLIVMLIFIVIIGHIYISKQNDTDTKN